MIDHKLIIECLSSLSVEEGQEAITAPLECVAVQQYLHSGCKLLLQLPRS